MRPPLRPACRRVLAMLACLATTATGHTSDAPSAYPIRPDDPRAVYLTAETFGAHGDGVADDAGALQAAIDRVEAQSHAGIVFVPAGRYRLGRTVYVWQGIRLIGYGAHRPVFVLGRDTPGSKRARDII